MRFYGNKKKIKHKTQWDKQQMMRKDMHIFNVINYGYNETNDTIRFLKNTRKEHFIGLKFLYVG